MTYYLALFKLLSLFRKTKYSCALFVVRLKSSNFFLRFEVIFGKKYFIDYDFMSHDHLNFKHKLISKSSLK